MPSPTQPLTLRKRADLVVVREAFGDKTYFVVKDPLALRYFRFQEEEFVQWELIDGVRSLEAMREELEARFAPQQFPTEGIARFVAGLHQSGLVTSDARGQAAPLLERRRKAWNRAWLQKLLSPTAIQFRGLDPTPLFDFLEPKLRWCYSPAACLIALSLIVAALGLVAVQYDEVARRLPTFHQFFTPGNMLLLLGLTGAIKVVHEFGHGLTCRRFGGECHELGLMFLVFAPCLYCNVSDSWRLTKRERIAVSAAGIVVELVIAALAVFGWWFSRPGALHQLCLSTMFVSGVSTLLVNGNPLMRYDGYFILADVVETPNLAEKSAAVIREFFARVCFGNTDAGDPLLPARNRGWFAIYGIGSLVYRVLVTSSIYLFLLAWLQPYRLEVLARAFGLIALATMLVIPFIRQARGLLAQGFGTAGSPRRRRLGITGLVAIATLALMTCVPLPHRVWGTLELEPFAAERIYVDVPGRIHTVAKQPGERVAAGAVLATLENLDLELEIADLVGRAAELRAQLAARRIERYHSAAAGQQIPELLQSLAGVEESLAEKRKQHDRLTLVAGRAGTVFPPPENLAATKIPQGELPGWSGLPSDEKNLATTLEAGTLFFQIGDTERWEALVAVDQADVELVALGQAAEIKVDELPDITFRGQVEEIARRELVESPRGLSNKVGGDLATETDAAGIERPLSATYQVRVVLTDPDALLRIGLRGAAKIHVPPTPLLARVHRWLGRTFHFDL
ncbi:MAG: HlyD family efflux transporter periplasmic adaptor subunit [Planctomycetia bacterium]|nr:HlyD family efflux transporter periplasmic adaptor subunit [Planctomycetia bacterium]